VLERCFGLARAGATVGGEIRGGLTTFMVMAYIIFVNPAILGFAGIPALQGQGPPFAATQASTCLVAGVMTIAMGLVANYPLALASGMGLNAAVAYQLVAGMKLPWQAAMGVVLLEGLVITVLVVTGLREAIMKAIPASLKQAIGVGIGLFILFIGLNASGIVKPGPPGVPVTLGVLTSAPVAVALFGLLLVLWFQSRGMTAGLLLGIFATTILAMIVNAWTGGRAFPLPGQAVIPKTLTAWPDFSSLGSGVDLSVFARVGVITAVVTIFSIMLSDFFDTMGTVIGVGAEGGWLTPEGDLPRLNRVLLVDSLPPCPVLRAGGGHRPRTGHRARPHPRRLPHDGARAPDSLRRSRGRISRPPHRGPHAVHLLHHRWHRGGLRLLLRDQAPAG